MTEKKHTPEPWPAFTGICQPATPHPESPAIAMLSWDDYIRARACVNACAGISTEVLEYNAMHGGVAGLERQRDQLRAALQNVVDAWSSQFERQGHLAPEWCKQARAALAATE